MEQKQEFSRIRSFIWPIHGYELKKFLPLTIIFFFISFNYSALRNLKDIFVIDNVSAEALYFIKMFGVTPLVVFYTLVYNTLINKVGRHNLFYGVIAYFLAFFTIFTFVLYPNAEYLTLNSFYDYFNTLAPNFNGFWGAIKYWFFSLFYIHAELWGTFGISVVLWSFINEITSVKQSKRFYSFLALGANIALIFSGSFLKMFKNNRIALVYMVIASGILTLLIYSWFYGRIKANPADYQIEEKKSRKKKPKLGFVESLKFLFTSKYLGLIAVLVLSYGFVISLIESVWKSQIKILQQVSSDTGLLEEIYGNEVILIGIVSIISIFTAASWIIKKSWLAGALITPIIASVLGAIFFSFMLFGRELTFFQSIFGVSSLMIAVVVGMLQVVFIKAFKYTLFDPTKEAAYIPLDSESKLKGKAAVDGVGGRLGKSGGSMLLTFVLIPFLGGGRIDGAIGYILAIVAIALFFWIVAAIKLDKEFKKKLAEGSKE